MTKNTKEQKEEAVVEQTAEQKAEETKRVAKCQEEVHKLLEENKCQFDVAVVLKAGLVLPQISIISK